MAAVVAAAAADRRQQHSKQQHEKCIWNVNTKGRLLSAEILLEILLLCKWKLLDINHSCLLLLLAASASASRITTKETRFSKIVVCASTKNTCNEHVTVTVSKFHMPLIISSFRKPNSRELIN